MSSAALRPTWKPFAGAAAAERQLHFSLRLMTGGENPKNSDLLKEVIAVSQ